MNEVALLGIPTDENSSFLRGPALAPPVIRQILYSNASELSGENGLDLANNPQFQDDGDLRLATWPRAFDQIAEAAVQRLAQGKRLLSLGGDHSITYPLIKGYAQRYADLTILQIDAHPDLFDEFDGSRFSHACPFARIMEDGLAKRLVQVGGRDINQHQRQQARRFEVEMIEMRDWHPGMRLDLNSPIYLSLDLDALDPAFAPGVSHHEPGGLTTREVLRLIQELPVPPVGADIVELNPIRDPQGITAALAAKFVKEIAVKMLEEE